VDSISGEKASRSRGLGSSSLLEGKNAKLDRKACFMLEDLSKPSLSWSGFGVRKNKSVGFRKRLFFPKERI